MANHHHDHGLALILLWALVGLSIFLAMLIVTNPTCKNHLVPTEILNSLVWNIRPKNNFSLRSTVPRHLRSIGTLEHPKTTLGAYSVPSKQTGIDRRASPADIPFYDYEVAKLADSTFEKLDTFHLCMNKFLGFGSMPSRKQQRAAYQNCLVEAYADLEKMLKKRGVDEVGYGEVLEDTNWADAEYVRAGRGEQGGWYFIRRSGLDGLAGHFTVHRPGDIGGLQDQIVRN